MSQTHVNTTSADALESNPVLLASGVRKNFRMGDEVIHVLRSVELAIRPGEFTAIEGRSGSGKSTLLHLLGALDEPNAGVIQYQGRNLASLSASERAAIRNEHFGFVFQFYHLLPELSVIENVLLPAMARYGWLSYQQRRAELRLFATQLLERLGLGHRIRHRPSQLSGGERQRVAIARALMNQPRVLFADEPTGNLDAETGRQIMRVLEGLHREENQTIVMVTHDRTLARQADRVLVLRDGRLENVEA
jgi:lipoprotein-releasing system ATP-binding protein